MKNNALIEFVNWFIDVRKHEGRANYLRNSFAGDRKKFEDSLREYANEFEKVFGYDPFDMDLANLEKDRVDKLEVHLYDRGNPFEEYSLGISRHMPRALLGNNNYLRFLREHIDLGKENAPVKQVKEKKAIFEGTLKEFTEFIGPMARNIVCNMARPLKTGTTCQHEGGCNKRKPLEAAHIKGKERFQIIADILKEKDFQLDKDLFRVDLREFKNKFIEAHTPIDKVILPMCKTHHLEYDKKENIVQEYPIILDEFETEDGVETYTIEELDTIEENEPGQIEDARNIKDLNFKLELWSAKPYSNVHKIIALLLENEGIGRNELIAKIKNLDISKNPAGAIASLMSDSGNSYGKVIQEVGDTIEFCPEVKEKINSYKWNVVLS